MPKRRRKKSFFDLFDLGEEDFLFGRESMEAGSGYSMSVTYHETGKPVVRVETHGDVDVAKLRRDIEERYPGARIEGLEKKPLIRIVDEEEIRKEKGKSERKAEREGKSRKR